jgi:hypothetical protein
MDCRKNNQPNPRDTKPPIDHPIDRAISPELDRIVQNDVTPENFAANDLKIYTRTNVMALETYLQRQSEQAAKCRQDE